MDELVISGKKYISSKRASEITGYAKDYIGQLARGGKVPATRIGRAWYVDEVALVLHGSTDQGEQVETEDKGIPLDIESSKVTLHRVTVSNKKIPTISHAFSQADRSLPSTWEPISYYDDETLLFPVTERVSENHFSSLNTTKNKDISSNQEKNNLRVRILRAKTGVEPLKVLFDASVVHVASKKEVYIEPKVIKKEFLRNKKGSYGFLPYFFLTAGSALFLFFILGSGLFVASHVNFAPSSGAYTANAYVSYQYAQDAIREIPGLQVGYDSLKGFFLFIKDSPGALFLKGTEFLKYLINLV
ncbi:MAG: helix-turn-helix domain-containing protein [Candidatus Pacebacteria bacterium]|nr:helix-turn-helix domain-containing protein [Candidatus Paceibacterota bacterium]